MRTEVEGGVSLFILNRDEPGRLAGRFVYDVLDRFLGPRCCQNVEDGATWTKSKGIFYYYTNIR